jgi:hypothetical protein
MQDFTKEDKTIWDMQEEPKKRGWIGATIFILLLLSLASWGYMAMSGVGLYYHLKPGHWAIEEHGVSVYDYRDEQYTYEDKIGVRYKGFGKVYTYPINGEFRYTGEDGIRCALADGGMVTTGIYLRLSMPEDEKKRLELHKYLRQHETNLKEQIKHDITNAIKSSMLPLTTVESTSSERSNIIQTFEGQLKNGLFRMEWYEDGEAKIRRYRFLKDEAGEYVKATEYNSFLEVYDLEVIQTAITEFNYSDDTLEVLRKYKIKQLQKLEAEARAKAEET